jgi:hypothetical protein
MEWSQIPIKNHAITPRIAHRHPGVQPLHSKIGCKLGLSAHRQRLTQSPVAIVALQDDAPARLKLQAMQGCLKRELTPIH